MAGVLAVDWTYFSKAGVVQLNKLKGSQQFSSGSSAFADVKEA